MRQHHRAGQKLFAGQTLPIYDRKTGEVARAQLFVAVSGASSYLHAEALASQQLVDWVAAPVHAFTFMGGCHEIVVCDNLRSGVTKPHRYEPDVNATYQEMAAHYGTAVIPARSYRPLETGQSLRRRQPRLRGQVLSRIGGMMAQVPDQLRVHRAEQTGDAPFAPGSSGCQGIVKIRLLHNELIGTNCRAHEDLIVSSNNCPPSVTDSFWPLAGFSVRVRGQSTVALPWAPYRLTCRWPTSRAQRPRVATMEVLGPNQGIVLSAAKAGSMPAWASLHPNTPTRALGRGPVRVERRPARGDGVGAGPEGSRGGGPIRGVKVKRGDGSLQAWQKQEGKPYPCRGLAPMAPGAKVASSRMRALLSIQPRSRVRTVGRHKVLDRQSPWL